MRVHEVAEELGVATNEVLDVLNSDLGIDVNHHMSGLDEDTVRRVKIVIQEPDLEPPAAFPKSRFKNLFGQAMDSLAFGVGLGLLLASERGAETRQTIIREVTELGKQFTEPITVGGEEVIDLLSALPAQVEQLTESAVNFDRNRLQNFGPMVQGALDDAVTFVSNGEFASFLSNGKGKAKVTEKKLARTVHSGSLFRYNQWPRD